MSNPEGDYPHGTGLVILVVAVCSLLFLWWMHRAPEVSFVYESRQMTER